MTHSDELLLDVLRRDWDLAAPPAAAARETDWAPMVEAALRHGVAGLVCRSLARLGSPVPKEIVPAAEAYLARAERAGAKRVADLFDVLDTLAQDGIPAITVKGAAIGVLAHASATLRPNRDIDVLVRREHMARAVASLHRLGYRSRHSFPPRVMESYYDTYGQLILLATERTTVEPHCAFAPHALAVDLDLEGMWQRARSLTVGGRTVSSLAPEDALLVACVHGTKEKWWRLLWVADVAALVHRHRALDFDALATRARTAGVWRMVLLGLGLARDLFAAPVPGALADAIDRDEACLGLLEQSKRYLFDPSSVVGSVNRFSRYHYSARERLADRIRYGFRLATTPGENHFRIIRLPGPLVPGYAAVKIVHDYLLLPVWKLGKRGFPSDKHGP